MDERYFIESKMNGGVVYIFNDGWFALFGVSSTKYEQYFGAPWRDEQEKASYLKNLESDGGFIELSFEEFKGRSIQSKHIGPVGRSKDNRYWRTPENPLVLYESSCNGWMFKDLSWRESNWLRTDGPPSQYFEMSQEQAVLAVKKGTTDIYVLPKDIPHEVAVNQPAQKATFVAWLYNDQIDYYGRERRRAEREHSEREARRIIDEDRREAITMSDEIGMEKRKGGR